ncbi:MAG: hypothetical protein JO317_05480, partial [Verrucomicrobiae bacterium]|nr:hypothetical protein [Verrucomicrobiae bacterium]
MMKLRTHDRTAVFFSAVLAFAALIGTKAPADVLFRDDFNGTSLSPYWRVNPGDYLGRTYLDQAPDVGGGVATLHLDTYSPTTPGLVVRGTEIQGQDFYAQGQGLEFEARMKFDPSTPNGVVQS